MADVAQQPFPDDALLGLGQMRRRAALRADLHHAVILAGSGEHCLAFANVHADGLLTVDVDSRAAGVDHRQRVPVIGSVDQDEVHLLLGEHFLVVAILARLPP